MKKYELSDQDLDVILRSLMEQPYKIVAKTIEKLAKQANEQNTQEKAPGADSGG